jgi:outer membrane protein OmpU
MAKIGPDLLTHPPQNRLYKPVEIRIEICGVSFLASSEPRSMNKTLISSVAVAALLGFGVPALADDEFKLEVGGFFVGAVSVYENRISTINEAMVDEEAYRFDGTSEVRFEGVSTLDSGLRYGFRAQVRVRNDIQRAAVTEDATDMLDEAFLFADSGFGRIELGKNEGVADQFSVRSPHALNNMSVSPGRDRALVDPLAITPIATVNDSSQRYAKFSYMTPSFGGLKLGMSFTPDTEDKTSDLISGKTKSGDDIVEFGVIYSRDFEDLSLDMSATYLNADSTPISDELEEWNAGVNVGFRGLSVGGSYRESGSSETGLQKYEAYDIGVAYETGPWKVSAQFAEHEGHIAGARIVDGQRYLISARYKVAKGLRIGAGFQRDLDILAEKEGSAFILESALKF